MAKTLTLVTRSSPLALRQTELTVDWLTKRLPEIAFEVRELKTTGDKQAQWSLEQRGGDGLFVKELEDALRASEADIAVHSAKDLPAKQPDGLEVVGYLPRANPFDVLIVREDVEKVRFIASSSPRRRAQLKALYPCAVWSEIRGNVETRLKKIANGKADATVLAAAGLSRLGIDAWPGLVLKPFTIEEVVPAAGQGAIALQVRAGEHAELSKVLCAETGEAVETEKALLAGLGGGCHTSIGVYRQGHDVWVYHEEHGQKHYPVRGNGDGIERLVQTVAEDLGMETEDAS
ncbi:MAG: hydroxymethylbilane synthase [Verrucomicrobiota bacterium]